MSFIVGDSHIFAIKQAIQDYNTQDLECIYLREKRYRPLYKKHTINRKLRKIILSKNQNNKYIFLSIRGNHHHILGLTNHPVLPFDFVLKEAPSLPLSNNSYIIPYSQIYKILFNMIEEKVLIPIKLFSILGNRHIFYLEPPPPIPSNEHIISYPDTFKDILNKYGISPKFLRLKLWRLHSNIIEKTCDTYGIKFIPIPKKSLDDEGFLKEEYWAKDPTHANSGYGKLVIDQIRNIIRG